MPITKAMFSELFDNVEVLLERSVRESDDKSWMSAENLVNDNQIVKIGDGHEEFKRCVSINDDTKLGTNKAGEVFIYEHEKVKMKVTIVLNSLLEKFVVQGVNSLWITAQKGLREKGTKWCLEHTSGVVFKSSDLDKGRTTLTLSDKVMKVIPKDASTDDLDAAIAVLQEAKLKQAK